MDALVERPEGISFCLGGVSAHMQVLCFFSFPLFVRYKSVPETEDPGSNHARILCLEPPTIVVYVTLGSHDFSHQQKRFVTLLQFKINIY